MAAPSFDSLPLKPDYPKLAAWGLYGDGPESNLGQLNLLTPERVKAAAQLIQTGERCSLNAPIDFMKPTAFGRLKPSHKIVPLADGLAFDDEVHCNTQGSTQWDGFRHFSSWDGRFYNGVTKEEILEGKSLRNSIHHWQERGIVGRGVFVDYYSWAHENGKAYDPLDAHPVQAEDLQACVEAQGMWIWDHQFAAVASDCPNFEMAPGHPEDGLVLHKICLGAWGLPLGEIFHLERLAELLKEQKRTTFFFVSEPLHVIGGIASPPNALALL